MTSLINLFRSIAVIILCLFMAACTHSASSSYNGWTSSEIREQKIKAARERAREARVAKREAWKAKQDERREARRSKRDGSKKTAKRSSIFGKRSAAKSNVVRKRSAKRVKKSERKRKIAFAKSKRKKVSVGKKRSVKSKKAFVPSAARKAGALRVNAAWNCVPKRLKNVIYQVRKRWGPVTVNSTYRSKRRNRLVGGKKRSYHLRCQAVDFRVHGSTRGLLTWLRSHPQVGGYKRYRSGFFHIDTGPKRTW